MATKRFKRLPSGRIQYHGETFAGFNKPKRAPKGSKKKFVVLGKEGDKVKKYLTAIETIPISESTRTLKDALISVPAIIARLLRIKPQRGTGRVSIFGK